MSVNSSWYWSTYYLLLKMQWISVAKSMGKGDLTLTLTLINSIQHFIYCTISIYNTLDLKGLEEIWSYCVLDIYKLLHVQAYVSYIGILRRYIKYDKLAPKEILLHSSRTQFTYCLGPLHVYRIFLQWLDFMQTTIMHFISHNKQINSSL